MKVKEDHRRTNVTSVRTTDPDQSTWQSSKKDVYKNMKLRDFAGGAVVKNPPANAGDMGLSPGLGRYHVSRSN